MNPDNKSCYSINSSNSRGTWRCHWESTIAQVNRVP